MKPDPRANPLAGNPFANRDDAQRAVRNLYEPLTAHTSPGGARVSLGSYSAVFPQRVAELEGFARPLYGIVPLTVGGGDFDHWDRIVAGLDSGTNPESAEYWGPVAASPDQRMVEQAAIGLALAFCPEQTWDAMDRAAQDRLAAWLSGIMEFEPVDNNWQFFRILVGLGLERVGVPFDRGRVDESWKRIESMRRGRHWYADGVIANVDYYVPFAFHTYGLMYAAAADIGLGVASRAEAYRERAAGFAADFRHWFGPDGAAIAYGRSMTYRFAVSSFWGALAWADVEAIPWGEARGLAMRNLRWWSQWPISDRDGVLSVGYAYDNRRLCESYNSAGSPYWSMKAFTGLAASADHPFWTADEEPLVPLEEPYPIPDAGWVVSSDEHQAVAQVARPAPNFSLFEQMGAKYRKFAYSSVFGFSGEVEAGFGSPLTDSALAVTVESGERRTRMGIEAAGISDSMVWSTWHPWDDIRIDTVTWGSAPWHYRIHRVRTDRPVRTHETGFALARDEDDWSEESPGVAVSDAGCSAIRDLGSSEQRKASIRRLPLNANLMSPDSTVPVLAVELEAGDHYLLCSVFASPAATEMPDHEVDIAAARALLDQISGRDVSPPASTSDTLGSLLRSRGKS